MNMSDLSESRGWECERGESGLWRVLYEGTSPSQASPMKSFAERNSNQGSDGSGTISFLCFLRS
jgi:hypothetical protein